MAFQFKNVQRYLRRRRLHRRGIRVDRAVPCVDVGGNSGWMIDLSRVHPDSIVYSFGVGRNLRWDLAMIDKFGVTVHAFDPTPVSVQWIHAQKLPDRLMFHDFGVAGTDGTLRFYPPTRGRGAHYSTVEPSGGVDPNGTIECKVFRLKTIMDQLGHDRIDVLKLDIEGSEYPVLQDFLATGIRAEQLLVEFHFPPTGRDLEPTVDLINRLRQAGFQIVHISKRAYEFSFIRLPAV